MLELTISFETTMADAVERKETRYEELVQSAQQAGYTTSRSTRCTTHDRAKNPQVRAETLVS